MHDIRKYVKLFCCVVFISVMMKCVWELKGIHPLVGKLPCRPVAKQGLYNLRQHHAFVKKYPYHKQQPTPQPWMAEIKKILAPDNRSRLRAALLHFDQSQMDFAGDYAYRVKYVRTQCCQSRCNMVLSLLESANGSVTHGGSGFNATSNSLLPHSQSLTINPCVIEDSLNGTYTTHCTMHSDCITVTIQLQYVDFNAYRGIATTIHQLVFNETLCRSKDEGITNVMDKPDDVQNSVLGWSQDSNGVLSYRSRSGVNYPMANVAPLCEHLRQYDNIYLLGASHMVLSSQYIKAYCPNDVDHLHLIHLRYANLFHKGIDGILHQRPRKSSRLLFMLQTGIWDLVYVNSTYSNVFTTQLEKYKTAIQMVIQFGLQRSVATKMIILSTPARKDTHRLTSGNNCVVAIFNELLREYVLELQEGIASLYADMRTPASGRVTVKYVDVFELTLPVVSNTNRDNTHFFQGKHTGIVGQVIMQLVMSHVRDN